MSVQNAYHYLFLGVLIVLAVLIGVVLIRSVIGPRVTDRILCINMIGTMVICSISVLSRMLDEGFLTDMALVYSLISVLSVMILATVYIPQRQKRGKFTDLPEEGGKKGGRKKK